MMWANPNAHRGVGARLLCIVAGLCADTGARAAQPFAAVVLRDDSPNTVTLAREPERIITLLPSLTETVCALGACDRLVATDRYSNWPARVRALPKTGGIDDAAIELIVSLRPDLVLLSRSQRTAGRLRELGIVVFALNTDRYADVARSVTVIGRLLGLSERAAALNRTIERSVDDIGRRATAMRHGDGAKVYFEVDQAPYAAGPQSFIGELLARIGARNIVAPELGPFPKLNPEYVVRHDPDVIFISSADAPRIGERPGWSRIRAVKEHRLCSFDAEVSDTFVRPGPRVADGMRAMAACLARVSP